MKWLKVRSEMAEKFGMKSLESSEWLAYVVE